MPCLPRLCQLTPLRTLLPFPRPLQRLVKDLLDLALVALDMEWAIPAANELFKVRRAGVPPIDLRIYATSTVLCYSCRWPPPAWRDRAGSR